MKCLNFQLQKSQPLFWAAPLSPKAMARISGLVPSRFLTLLAHLVVVITLFWSRVRCAAAPLPSHSHLRMDPVQPTPP